MTDKQEYKKKVLDMQEAVKLIASNDRVMVSPATQMPIEFLTLLAQRYEELENVKVSSSFPLAPLPFLMDPRVAEKIHFTGFFMGPVDRKVYPLGFESMMSVNFSNIGKAIKEVIKPNVYVTTVSPMDDDGYFNFGPMGTSIGRECTEFCEKIIVQVSQKVPRVNGENTRIHLSEIDYIIEKDFEMMPLPEPKPKDVDQEIAKLIVPKIKDGSTIQIGFGGLSGAVSYGLKSKKNLSVHTEMITESMKYLAEVGAITGKIKGGFAFGSNELYNWTGDNPQVEVDLVSHVNQAFEVGKYDDFVSINACLMVDLTGQVVSEGSGHRIVSSVGGASDFVRGAGASNGGQSFICVASTRIDEETGQVYSNIVSEFEPGTPISVPRADVMTIVTEYGIADLYNKTMEERAMALIEVAHPDFRAELRDKATKAGILRQFQDKFHN
ncbi:acetyl-CoA hydrolase/transferase C-terminal domain-containing protein [Streptococcus iniae]|uniref:acetyl-CoA hydrolase/transferase family protein n=1 Tax=Streptococcus iniae TaxID=1346 RepID=UPI002B2B69FC|nr:acetyl-CoA hydrolase/transferase C-terminal domain-containing protein [Streptococcus iniae]WNZ90467.1 acetyl-CoA hydrolase/transferase C-terminal domain-containing protein [Streptococcus iniae]WNZ93502.1 acetyl-CoA hydrolase/transferase C-terminal domain-containing protein [Streptococcus iniae]WNZ94731.1 acetyl-CoA hydrolase/transferase C-terminal domain-containing protein [Streptococcus iniae]WNZ97713.1 acetyl-CoA hydrolase/transferase C-terminal domain-containing protein [Streptococcus ini